MQWRLTAVKGTAGAPKLSFPAERGYSMEPYEWIELAGLAIVILLLLDIHWNLRDIARQLALLARKSH